jgi:hypothetical protein
MRSRVFTFFSGCFSSSLRPRDFDKINENLHLTLQFGDYLCNFDKIPELVMRMHCITFYVIPLPMS